MHQLRHWLLCTTAAVGVGVSAASAADLPVKAPARIAAAPVANWTGCYVGGHVGGGFGNKKFTDMVMSGEAASGFSAPPPAALANESIDLSGALGGAQVGCDWQFNRNWLIGIEGTFTATNLSDGTTRTEFNPFNFGSTPGVLNLNASVDWVATLVGKLGYVQNDKMAYLVGGFAWAHDKYRADGSVNLEGEGLGNFSMETSETRPGYVVGIGLAALLANNIFGGTAQGFVEYNYMDFGKRGKTLNGLRFPPFSEATTISLVGDIRQEIHVIKAGINLRFP